MPGFVSHTVMAKDVCNKLNNKHVNFDYMVTYSLGGDLCKYAKCRYDSHHKDMDKFIYDMADYIKDNNLINDKKVMGVLYGHICHYIMDKTIHPLVRIVDKSCIKNKHNHTLIEVYFDNYLVNYRYHISKQEYLKKGILKTKSNDKINRMIDCRDVYNTNSVSRYYRFNLFLYKMLKNIYIFSGDKLTNKLMELDKFISSNKNIDLVNLSNEIKYKDSLRNVCNDDLDTLYDISIEEACEYIKNINKYLGL